MRRLAVVTVAVVMVILIAAPAFAHATYKSSNPADESTVSSAPSQITAEFTEPMVDGSYMDVTDPCGRDTGSGSSQSGSSMSVQNSGAAAGTYEVFWRAVSIDGHITEGEFTFTSSGGEPCPGEEQEVTSGGSRTGGGAGGGRGSSTGTDASGTGDSTAAVGAGSNANGGDAEGARHANHGNGSGGERKNDAAAARRSGDFGPVAQGRGPDVPDAPSALEGIPVDGLVLTLAVAALIGAAAGKIYVSLSGDDS